MSLKSHKKQIFIFSCLVIALFSFQSCKKKLSKEEAFRNDVHTVIVLYANNEYGESNIDSVVISSIDTLTKLGYAKMTLEMLENMHEEYQGIYQKALDEKDLQSLPNIENTIDEITSVMDFFRRKTESESLDDSQLLLYIVPTIIYQKNAPQEDKVNAIYFLTPDLRVHILDPFSDHFLE